MGVEAAVMFSVQYHYQFSWLLDGRRGSQTDVTWKELLMSENRENKDGI